MATSQSKNSLDMLKNRKRDDTQPLVCLTAYTAPMAAMMDGIVDLILVGDSLAMVLYGEESTREVDLGTMIRHGRAVARMAKTSLVVVDMPYGSYENDPKAALDNARKVMDETGCDAVKIEGGQEIAQTAQLLVDHDIPVIGHIGLLPQSVEGAYKVQGSNDDAIHQLVQDAKALEQAGVSAIVVEAVYEHGADIITNAVSIPTIGIGASAHCDGQILVSEDMLGLSVGRVPKFVHHFANLKDHIGSGIKAYAADVKARRFPKNENLYRKKA